MPGLRPLVAAVVFSLSLSGCGGPSVQEQQQAAQALLDKGDFAGTQAAADKSLQDSSISSDPAKAWRFESIRLEALAGAGKGKDVAAALEKDAGTWPTQVTAALYRSLAAKLAAAKDTSGASDVLVAGDARFPADHDSFQKAIDELKTQLAPDKVASLKALGYL